MEGQRCFYGSAEVALDAEDEASEVCCQRRSVRWATAFLRRRSAVARERERGLGHGRGARPGRGEPDPGGEKPRLRSDREGGRCAICVIRVGREGGAAPSDQPLQVIFDC